MHNANGKKVGHEKFELVEYDMLLPVPELTIVPANGKNGKSQAGNKQNKKERKARGKRAALSYTSGYWSGGVVPYVISSSYSKILNKPHLIDVTSNN